MALVTITALGLIHLSAAMLGAVDAVRWGSENHVAHKARQVGERLTLSLERAANLVEPSDVPTRTIYIFLDKDANEIDRDISHFPIDEETP